MHAYVDVDVSYDFRNYHFKRYQRNLATMAVAYFLFSTPF